MRRRRSIFLAIGGVALVAIVAGGTLLAVRRAGSGPTAPPGPVVVRWFVGFGTGLMPSQTDVQQAFVDRYNRSQSRIHLDLQVVTSGSAMALSYYLPTFIENGTFDILGPLGVGTLNGFDGKLLDLAPLVRKHKFNLAQFPPAMVDILKRGSALVSLPYGIYPAFLLYNKDLFAAAGLPDLPTHIGQTYMGKTWDWAEVRAIGMKLTLDSKGRHPYDPGFDADDIVQFGLDFQYWDGRRIAAAFGQAGAQLVDPADPSKAKLSDNFKAAVKYFYDGMWTSHFIPTGKYRASDLLNGGATFASGKIAMNASNTWCLGGCYFGDVGATKMHAVGIAVMPSYNGVTAGPLDFDGFSITKGSKHPDEAFQAMLAVMAEPTLLDAYGELPAVVSQRASWEQAQTAAATSYFPTVTSLSWSAVEEMAAHPADPSHEGYMPNYTKAVTDYGTTFTDLQNTPGLNVDDELANLQKTLQTDFDATGTPSPP